MLPSTIGNIRSGKLRLLALWGTTRLPIFPDVPTVAEAGYPGFEAITWYGVFLPAGAAPAITAKLNMEFVKLLNNADFRAWLAEHGVGTEVYYPLPVHLQPALADFGYKAGDFPVSEQLAREALALPIFPELAEEEIRAVAALIREFYGGSA